MIKSASKFIFDNYSYNDSWITFNYKIIFNDQKSETFIERLKLPEKFELTDQVRLVLKSVFIILGISYYKLYCPKKIEFSNLNLSKKEALFWNFIYEKGLGEFFYKNNIDFQGLIYFPYSNNVQLEVNKDSKPARDKKQNILLPFGGGKDSIVAAHILKNRDINFSTFTLNPHPMQLKLIEKLGVNNYSIERHIDSKLFELNKTNTVYNGHVPMTAIYSVMALLVSVQYGFTEIAMSNEKSANFGNVEYLGKTINHQWSKSAEFETLFADYILDTLDLDIKYYSLLRNQYEIAVVEKFAEMTQYHDLFVSCNVNFKNKKTDKKLWCGKCAKCAFVFCLLSAFITKSSLIAIFKDNLYDKPDLISIYRQLLGINEQKPFDCVGTPEETIVAMQLANKTGEYNGDVVIQMFISEILPKKFDISKMKHKVLSSR